MLTKSPPIIFTRACNIITISDIILYLRSFHSHVSVQGLWKVGWKEELCGANKWNIWSTCPICNTFFSSLDKLTGVENHAYRSWSTQDQWLLLWFQPMISGFIMSWVVSCFRDHQLKDHICTHFQNLVHARARKLRLEMCATSHTRFIDGRQLRDHIHRHFWNLIRVILG